MEIIANIKTVFLEILAFLVSKYYDLILRYSIIQLFILRVTKLQTVAFHICCTDI